VPSATGNFVLEDRYSSVLSQLKKEKNSESLKFNNFDFFKSLKLRILVEKILLFLLG